MSAATLERPATAWGERTQALAPATGGWTFTDFFCGFGGSSIGLTEAGGVLVWAANHWDLAIDTHAANFRNADHFQGDISGYDMRRVPKADVFWMSPECTWHSPAGGRKRVSANRAELDAFDDYVPDAAGERSRATMWDVVRAAEAKQPKVLIVENVVEVTSWPLFETWLAGMTALGYEHQILCASAAHIGGELNPHAPQWRDRIYFIFYKKGVPFPNVQPRPLAWCSQCEGVVEGVQSWKKKDTARQIGKYGPQYVYVCSAGKHASHIVEPYVLPAASAIDWSDLGEKIGDRPLREFKDKKTGAVTMGHLAPATMRRVGVGIRMFARPVIAAAAGQTWDASSNGHPGGGYHRVTPADTVPLPARTGTAGDALSVPPFMASVNHGEDDDGRLYDPSERPLPARSTKIGDAVVMPFVVERRDYHGSDQSRLHPVDEPMSTRTASDRGIHGLVLPVGGTWSVEPQLAADEPFRTRTTAEDNGLVTLPFIDVARTHNRPHSISEPLAPLTTGQNEAVVTPPFMVYNYDHDGGDERRIKPVDGQPLGTVVADGRHDQLVTPPFVTELHGTSTARGADDAFIQKHHGGVDYKRIEHMLKSTSQPLPSVVARVNLSLVIPYRRGAKAYGAAARPLHTLATHDSGALVEPSFTETELEDMILNSMFRMLGPREHLRAQRFPDSYEVKGNKSEQTKGAGNAVASNVAHYLGVLCGQALGTPAQRVA